MKPRCFCPELSVEEFAGLDLKEFDFTGKTFYVTKIPIVSHFPMSPEIKIEQTMKEIEKKGYQTAAPLFIIFEDGLLVGKIMIEIIKPSGKDENIQTVADLKLIGRTFKGPRFLVPKALKEFDRYLMSKMISTSEFYFWYHSCRICEKERGTRTLILGKISN